MCLSRSMTSVFDLVLSEYFLFKNHQTAILCLCIYTRVYESYDFLLIFLVTKYHGALMQLFKPEILLYQEVIFFIKLQLTVLFRVVSVNKYIHLIWLLHNMIKKHFFGQVNSEIHCVSCLKIIYEYVHNRNFKASALGFTCHLHPLTFPLLFHHTSSSHL